MGRQSRRKQWHSYREEVSSAGGGNPREKPARGAFRRGAALLGGGTEQDQGALGVRDRLAQGWAPLFERFRNDRVADILCEQDRLRTGTSQAVAHLAQRVGEMWADVGAARAFAALQFLRASLDRTSLYLFTPSAFAMCAYLLARDTRIAVDLLPRDPLWIEYDRPRRIAEALPDLATGAFWFANPFQPENKAEAMRRGYLPPDQRDLAHAFRGYERGAWMLEVYAPGRGVIAVLTYSPSAQSWDFAPTHVQVCPRHQCAIEWLDGGGGFIVGCSGCRAALPLYARVIATSLLITSGAFRSEPVADSAPTARGAPSATGSEQAARQPSGPRLPHSSGRERGKGQGHRAEEVPPPANQGDPGKAPRQREVSHDGYTIVEFDASVRPRQRSVPGARRQHWSLGREIIDLAALNDLTVAVDEQAVVLVDLSFSGITRTLRSSYFRHKQGQVIAVKDFTVPRVRMTYATYRRRLLNRRITKVTALRYRGVAAPGWQQQRA